MIQYSLGNLGFVINLDLHELIFLISKMMHVFESLWFNYSKNIIVQVVYNNMNGGDKSFNFN